MVNKKRALRIGAFMSILMFLLIPLLSSPVAASFTLGIGGVVTNATPGGPTASGTISGPATVSDTAPFNARFSVTFNYRDTQWGPQDSLHWVVIIVSWQPGGVGPWLGPVPLAQAQVRLSPGTSQSGTFITSPTGIVAYGGKGTNFVVSVTVYCQDLNTMTTASWTSPANAVVFTII